ncbi:chitinase [Hordeum vulgare]|nr:chitinase [Hordeum vulgare]
MARFGALAALLLAVAVGGAAAQGVGTVITRSVYASMLPNRDNALCPGSGFYTYDAFIAAANTFPGFGTTGSADDVKRELAAFFGQTSHETTGGTIGAADQFQWGYCFKEERSKATSPPYYGRGPIQLTGRSNYDVAGRAIGKDLGNKPSSHSVALRRWTPTAADTAAGRVPGYGVITNIINGGLECGMGRNDANVDRIGYYTRYCGMLGTAAGGNLDCFTQRNFAS